jgi:hypothetical protein
LRLVKVHGVGTFINFVKPELILLALILQHVCGIEQERG